MLSHSPEWVKRKYEQAVEERYIASKERTLEGYKGLMLLADTLFNKGTGFKDILPDYMEEKEQQEKFKAKQEEYVSGNWWESE